MSCIFLTIREMTKDVMFQITGWDIFGPDSVEPAGQITKHTIMQEIRRGRPLLIIDKQVYDLTGLANDLLAQLASKGQNSKETNEIYQKQFLRHQGSN